MSIRDRLAGWVDKRTTPRKVHPRDSVTIVYQGPTPDATHAAELEKAVAAWRAGSPIVLFLPAGSKMEVTRRPVSVLRRLGAAATWVVRLWLGLPR
jgi:hypothetical protein